MLEEAQVGNKKSNEGVHGVDNPFHSFFNGVESSTLEDFSRLGNLEVLKKDTSSESSGSSSSPKLIN